MDKFLRKIAKPLQFFNQPWYLRRLDPQKKQIIDFTFNQLPKPRSFADLGAVWGIDGAYTFYTLETYAIEKAILVDTNITDTVNQYAHKHPNLTILMGNFGEEAIIQQIGEVDAIFLFDVLLHQVAPDWDEILEHYATRTHYMVIFNQQSSQPEKTVRLLDLGTEEYFRRVPHNPDELPYKGLFEKLDDIHPQHKRPWRDIHNIWQWGITDKDLIEKMKTLGFELQFFKNCGQFSTLKDCENHAFVFQKSQ